MNLLVNSVGINKGVLWGLLLIAGITPGGAIAADMDARDTKFFHTPPSVAEIGEHLFPTRTRGLVVNRDNLAENSVGLPVLFHFGTTELMESSKPYLHSIGQLMQQEAYVSETLIIEGHTDAVGTDKNNALLSKLRALAVKDFLVKQYAVEPLRLFPVGKGEKRLFDAANPNSGANRRVEFLRYR